MTNIQNIAYRTSTAMLLHIHLQTLLTYVKIEKYSQNFPISTYKHSTVLQIYITIYTIKQNRNIGSQELLTYLIQITS